MPKYEVPVIYRGQSNFIVNAATPAEAQQLAQELFDGGAEPVILGNEWEQVEKISVPTLVSLRETLVIDGTNEDGELAGDGTRAPFFVFDPSAQRNVAGPFDTREAAHKALLNLRGIEELDMLHAEMEQTQAGGDLFDRVGTIIAMLKGEHDPDAE